MAFYYFMPFLAPLIIMFSRVRGLDEQRLAWIISSALLVIFVGLRDQVGGDWGVYSEWVHKASDLSAREALLFTDFGYAFVNYIVSKAAGNLYIVNFICATIAISCLCYFCRKQKEPALALFVAIPYLVVVVFIGYTRQGVAIGFGMLALLAVRDKNIPRFFLWVILAALFHKPAVVLFFILPAIFAENLNKKSFVQIISAAIFTAILAFFLFGEIGIYLARNYLFVTGDSGRGDEGGLYSGGAVYRLSQSMLAVVTFYFIAHRRHIERPEFWAWSICSGFVAVLFVLSFWWSTFSDRLALYFIPLQLFAFSGLPSVLNPPWRIPAYIGVMLGSIGSLWIWLSFGHYASSWLPYRNLLLP